MGLSKQMRARLFIESTFRAANRLAHISRRVGSVAVLCQNEPSMMAARYMHTDQKGLVP